jgi:hypothetical protein
VRGGGRSGGKGSGRSLIPRPTASWSSGEAARNNLDEIYLRQNIKIMFLAKQRRQQVALVLDGGRPMRTGERHVRCGPAESVDWPTSRRPGATGE